MQGKDSEEIAPGTSSFTRRAQYREGNSSESILCKYHLERKGQRVPAKHMIDGDPMCEDCYRGAPMGTVAYRSQKKLSEKQNREIYLKMKHGATAIDLAEEYGVSKQVIHRIRHNILYRFS